MAFELILRIGKVRGTTLLGMLTILLTIGMTLTISLPQNDLFRTFKGILTQKTSVGMTWEQFYAEDVFGEIKADLDTRENGLDYKVASIGLHPAVALYNGFQTVDGYSVNYPLAYKHQFSEVIAEELKASPELFQYYWDWGSRCYVFSHELGRQYLFPKDSARAIGDLRINIEAFKEMDGKYIFSAVPILNAEDIGLSEYGSYSTPNSYYKIYVYEVL